MLNKARLIYNQWKNNKYSASIGWQKLTGVELSEESARKSMNSLYHIINAKSNENITLAFGDVHAPFDHPNYLKFLKETYKSYGCSNVVNMGDLVDNHAISRHQNSPRHMSPLEEYNQTKKRVKLYTDAFPEVKMCVGNHDNIHLRQAHTVDMPDVFIKSFENLWELPDTWELAEQHIINGVVYKHGISCGGKDGAFNTALVERMSTVIGHTHAYAGVKYSANSRDIIYGMNCGCGIDVDAYAFEYGKHSKYKPVLGCGIVYSSNHAIFVPMPEKYFRS